MDVKLNVCFVMVVVGMGLALNPDNQRKLAAMRQALVAAEDGPVSANKQLLSNVSIQPILNASFIYCVGKAFVRLGFFKNGAMTSAGRNK